MLHNMTKLGVLRHGTPAEVRRFRAMVIAAMKGARLADAAEILGISKASLKVYLSEDPVLREIARPGRGRPKRRASEEKNRGRKKELDAQPALG